jgi:hypothetical protein
MSTNPILVLRHRWSWTWAIVVIREAASGRYGLPPTARCGFAREAAKTVKVKEVWANWAVGSSIEPMFGSGRCP